MRICRIRGRGSRDDREERGACEKLRVRALTAAILLPALSAGAQLVVDDDRAQCPAARFSTIQAAVDAASPGDTVLVCAGTYAESVRVTKTLTLLGAKHGKDGRKRTLTSPGESVVAGDRPFVLA